MTITGTGFGTNPNVAINGTGISLYVYPGASDSEIALQVTVDPSAPTQTNVQVTVTSNGYGGGQFFYEPQGGQSNQVTQSAQIQAVSCGDARDSLIGEYRTYNVNLTPLCAWFTQSAHSVYFTYNELTTQSDYSWALIKKPLTVSASSGSPNYGLDKWRELIGLAQTVNSGYRNPSHNASVGGAAQSRHMYGDAVDLRNVARTEAEYWDKACKARKDYNATFISNCDQSQPDARADYVEPLTGPCGYGCVHADWRSHDLNVYSQ